MEHSKITPELAPTTSIDETKTKVTNPKPEQQEFPLPEQQEVPKAI